MLEVPIYNPRISYEENYERGPFGAFAQPGVLKRAGIPRFSFLGHPVWQPLGIPAGPLVNGNFVKAALDKGFDIPVYKTVRTRAYKSHPWPNVLPVDPGGDLDVGRTLVAQADYTEPLSITNSFGVPSMDPDIWQPDLAACVAHANEGQIVVGSFQGTLPDRGGVDEYIEDFRRGARMMRETGVHAVEVNFSCPNEGTAHLLCFDTHRSAEVAAAVREELGDTPLIVKIAYFEDPVKLAEFVREVGPHVSAFSAINTVSAKIVDSNGNQALPGEGRLMSGVCGRSIRWAGLSMAGKLARLREEFELEYAIVGVGGVTEVADIGMYLDAGADAVMSATGAMWNSHLGEEAWATMFSEVTA